VTTTPTFTPTPSKTPDTQAITEVLPYPNPVDPADPAVTQVFISFKINQENPDAIGLKIYTSASRLIRNVRVTGPAAINIAKNRIFNYGKAELNGLSSGVYYYYLYAEKGGVITRSRIDKLMVLKKTDK
jgi:hypothetical protein